LRQKRVRRRADFARTSLDRDLPRCGAAKPGRYGGKYSNVLLTLNPSCALVRQYGAIHDTIMGRLLFDRKGQLVCAGVWGAAWLGVAAALLLPAAVAAPDRTDLVAHFLLFGAMAFGAVGFSRRPGQLACLALTTVALGAALEFAQQFVPYRTFDVIDAVANGVGALAGYAVALLVLYYVIRPAAPRYRDAAS
jgi:VanZ like family